jgi:ABC-type transport system involved in cytochrome bd biosynthesis fused ATPase/permease subunit
MGRNSIAQSLADALHATIDGTAEFFSEYPVTTALIFIPTLIIVGLAVFPARTRALVSFLMIPVFMLMDVTIIPCMQFYEKRKAEWKLKIASSSQMKTPYSSSALKGASEATE